jgi:predicted amidohydrolase
VLIRSGTVIDRSGALDARLGTLTPGALADVTLLRLAEDPCTFVDALGATVGAEARLVPVRVIRNGVLREAGLQRAIDHRVEVSRSFG